MSWDAFWSYFTEQPTQIKRDLLEQLDLVTMMKALPIEERRIVLKSAPRVLIDTLAKMVTFDDKVRYISGRFSR